MSPQKPFLHYMMGHGADGRDSGGPLTGRTLSFVKEHTDPTARHNCFAYRLADGSSRSNGDGEPGGTAGPPLLAAIVGADLHDVAVLVTRYKPSEAPKLGTGGLVRAYGGAAAGCLAEAELTTIEARVRASVTYAPKDTGVIFSLLGAYAPQTEASAGGGAMLVATFEAPPDEIERLAAALEDATAGRIGGIEVAEE